jgi:hypothetical protein
MPEIVNGYEYLRGYWEEAGAFEINSNGVCKLSWQEIESWLNVKYSNLKNSSKRHTRRRNIGVDSKWVLSDWEIEMVRKMSEEYVSEYNQARDKQRPAPYVAETVDEDVQAEMAAANVARIMSQLRSHKKAIAESGDSRFKSDSD